VERASAEALRGGERAEASAEVERTSASQATSGGGVAGNQRRRESRGAEEHLERSTCDFCSLAKRNGERGERGEREEREDEWTGEQRSQRRESVSGGPQERPAQILNL